MICQTQDDRPTRIRRTAVDEIERALAAGGSVILDFEGVPSVSDYFMDELLGMLIVRPEPGVLDSLVFANCAPNVAETIRFTAEEALSQGANLNST